MSKISICITSYNRVKELLRCMKSVDSVHYDDVEIIVSEDRSPMREQIREQVEAFAKTSKYKVVFNSNEVNLGYDNNLAKLATLASGEYILYISDDDAFFEHSLDQIYDFIQEHPAGLYFSGIWTPWNTVDRSYKESITIQPGIESVKQFLYDPILFSGLTFKREYIKDIDATRFKNLNYFQVYLFYTMMYKYNSYYINTMLINSISDGENAYGKVDSSEKNAFLANRNSYFSNLEFHRGLIKAIRLFDEDNNCNVIDSFAKAYSLRTVNGLIQEKKKGFKNYNAYWEKLKSLDINLSGVCKMYHAMIAIFGWHISSFFFSILRKIYTKLKRSK